MAAKTQSKERDVEDFFNLSGAAMNRIRSSSTVESKMLKSKTKPLHIDLYNFDDPKYEDSKYILTSPRSLEACSRLSVKPVELLYKPLVEFQDEMIPQGFSLRTIYEIYDAQEHERLNKLQLCREERNKVIVEDEISCVNTEGPIIKDSPSQLDKYIQSDILKEGDQGDASLQRQRTAWATSVGHRRITQEEINERAREIYEQGDKLRKQSLQKCRPRRRPKSAPPAGKTRKKNITNTNNAAVKKKQERQQRAEKAAIGQRGSQESIADSVTSSRASRPWIRDPLADAKPVADPILRQKLQRIIPASGRISSRSSNASIDGALEQRRSAPVMRTSDQKILQLMIAKRETERHQLEQRDIARKKWEEDKRREATAKNASQNRRRSVATPDRRKSASSSCLHIRNGTPCNCGRNHEKQIEGTPYSSRESLRYNGDGSPGVENGDTNRRSWVIANQKRQELQHRQMEEKRQRELERKKSVEERLERQRKENEDYQRKLKEKQQRDMEKAEMVRSSHEQQKELRLKLNNLQEKQRYEERISQIKHQSTEDLVAMRASIDLRGHLTDGKTREMAKRKQKDSKRRSLDLDNRLLRYKDNKQKMDEELHKWHEDLLSYRQLQEKRAEQLAKQQALERAKRAQEERITKEKMQKENMKKLLSAEEEWKAEVEASIALKDSKTQMLQREKEELIEQSRSMAQATQRLREDLRQHYSLNDLDKLNKQAELEARLSLRTMESATHNLSRLNLDS